MCRSGVNGRRCPGQDDPAYREARNAKRRTAYAQKKSGGNAFSNSVSSVNESASTEYYPDLLNLPVTTGIEMGAFEFKSRLPSAWNPDTFTAVGNGSFGGNGGYREKPSGGLWSSPIERDEDMEISEYDNFFNVNPETSDSINHDVMFTPDAKVLIVNSRADYDTLLSSCSVEVMVGGSTKRAVDYERLSKGFDAVYFTTNAIYANGKSNPADEYFKENFSLQNMDIASLLIMNPKAVKVTPGE